MIEILKVINVAFHGGANPFWAMEYRCRTEQGTAFLTGTFLCETMGDLLFIDLPSMRVMGKVGMHVVHDSLKHARAINNFMVDKRTDIYELKEKLK